MELSAESKALHARLSKHQLHFLEYVRNRPEFFDRQNFTRLDEVPDWLFYPLQSWPTFMSKERLREASDAAVGVCRLAKQVPKRVFEGKPEEISNFYNIEFSHAQLVVPVLLSEKKLSSMVARPDMVHTKKGFQCLECNLVGNIGGWESEHWAQAYLEVPLIARYLAETGLQPHCTSVMRHFLAHMLRQALQQFQTSEVNLLLGAMPTGKETKKENLARLVEVVNGGYQELLGKVGLKGVVLASNMSNLEIRDQKLFVEGTRIHGMLELFNSAADLEIYRAWMRGNLQLYNGPVSPILTDKRNLAILSELQESSLFNEGEKTLIRRSVPWTRRVSSEPLCERWPGEPVTVEQLLQKQEMLVLKPGSGSSGFGVHIGAQTEASVWRKLVKEAFEDGTWIAQEVAESLPYLYHDGISSMVPFNLIWSLFVFGDSYGGCMMRLLPKSESWVINSAQGCIDCAIFEVDE